MTTIAVTGASGHLGSATLSHLTALAGPGTRVVAITRNPSPASGDTPRVEVRRADFDDPPSLRTAYAGVDVLVVVSGDAPVEVRTTQHRAAVDAASAAGVGHIVYTSVAGAGHADSPFPFVAVHRDTEERLARTDVPWTVLRNGLYAELLAEEVDRARGGDGILRAPAPDALLTPAFRSDLAEAAARVALDAASLSGATLELTGPEAISYADLASAAGLEAHAIGDDDLRAGLGAAGLPPFLVDAMSGMWSSIARGDHAAVSADLERVLGRAPRRLADALAPAV